jgi:hypothetical protein
VTEIDTTSLIVILGILVSIFATIIAGLHTILRRIGAVEQVVNNGLGSRVESMESWIAWLVKDKVEWAERSGRQVPTPLPDTEEIEKVSPS